MKRRKFRKKVKVNLSGQGTVTAREKPNKNQLADLEILLSNQILNSSFSSQKETEDQGKIGLKRIK